MKKAYEELEKRGAIITISTKGTFVAENTDVIIKKTISEKIDFIKKEMKELVKLGLTEEEIINKINED